MRARDYVALALAGVTRARPRSAWCSRCRRKLRSALDRFADPAWAPTAGPGWPRWPRTRCARPSPARTTSWPGPGRSPPPPARRSTSRCCAGCWTAPRPVPGLAVDTDLRWTLLQALVAVGAAGGREIEAELDRDPTASGQRRAATARALRPTAEAKAEAWRLATEDDELPNAINEAIIGGFHHPAQHELTAPYVEPYFAVIPDVWERRTSETAQNVVVGLFPDRSRRRRGGGGRVPGRRGQPAGAAPAGRRGPRRRAARAAARPGTPPAERARRRAGKPVGQRSPMDAGALSDPAGREPASRLADDPVDAGARRRGPRTPAGSCRLSCGGAAAPAGCPRPARWSARPGRRASAAR